MTLCFTDTINDADQVRLPLVLVPAKRFFYAATDDVLDVPYVEGTYGNRNSLSSTYTMCCYFPRARKGNRYFRCGSVAHNINLSGSAPLYLSPSFPRLIITQTVYRNPFELDVMRKNSPRAETHYCYLHPSDTPSIAH